MKCPTCGNNIPDGVKFCSKCGTKINQSATPSAPIEPVSPDAPVKSVTRNDSRSGEKKTGTTLLITFAVLLLLAAVAGGGYIGYQFFQKMSNQPENSDGWGKSTKNTKEETSEKPAAAETEAETNATAPSAVKSVTQPFAVPSDSNTANITEASAAWAGNPTDASTTPWTVNQTAGTTAPLTNNTQTQATNLPTAYNSFILPDSATRYLGITDIETLTLEQLRIARNEIYARHGRKFKDSGLQTYFNAQSWYTGTIEANQFSDDAMLNDIERKNLDVIKAREADLN